MLQSIGHWFSFYTFALFFSLLFLLCVSDKTFHLLLVCDIFR